MAWQFLLRVDQASLGCRASKDVRAARFPRDRNCKPKPRAFDHAPCRSQPFRCPAIQLACSVRSGPNKRLFYGRSSWPRRPRRSRLREVLRRGRLLRKDSRRTDDLRADETPGSQSASRPTAGLSLPALSTSEAAPLPRPRGPGCALPRTRGQDQNRRPRRPHFCFAPKPQACQHKPGQHKPVRLVV